MNWIQGIQRAIDYVESHITEELDFEAVAKQAYSSSFHFQRIFGILCGFSLGDYIRMRRLSLAGEELSRGNAKIIEVAMKYGYDTPESFSRAFTRFHGIAPSEAKRGGGVRIFTPLSVKLILTGGKKWTTESKNGTRFRSSASASRSISRSRGLLHAIFPPCGGSLARTARWSD